MTPESGGTRPAKMPTNVDLPAPFSPTSAWTSPPRSSNDTSRSAVTPPYDLLTDDASSRAIGQSDNGKCQMLNAKSVLLLAKRDLHERRRRFSRFVAQPCATTVGTRARST